MEVSRQALDKEDIASSLHGIDERIRESHRLVFGRVSSDRLDILKDYMYIALTVIGVVATAFATDRSDFFKSDFLVGTGVVLLVIVVIYSLISRIYLIANIEEYLIFIENSFAEKYQIVEMMAICNDQDKMAQYVSQLDDIRDQKMNAVKWPDKAHQYISLLFIPGILLMLLSLLIPLNFEMSWNF